MTDKRDALLRGVIQCVAREGVGAASTRSIAEHAGISDSHIYRFFKDRDELINAAYIETSGKVFSDVRKCIRSLQDDDQGLDFEARFRLVFHTAWRDLLDDPDVCRFLVYYYHSPNFMRYAYKTNSHQIERIVVSTAESFGSLQEAQACVNILFTQIYDFAMQVANGIREDTGQTEEEFFQILFRMRAVQQHIEKHEQQQ